MLEIVQNQYEHEEFFAYLIEQAFLETQIDGDQQTLAYFWLRRNYYQQEH